LNKDEKAELVALTQKGRPGARKIKGIVASEVGAWKSERNAARATIDWRFTIPNARDKLKKLYSVREEQRLTIAP
jgi:hypothetical protein